MTILLDPTSPYITCLRDPNDNVQLSEKVDQRLAAAIHNYT